MIYFGVVAKASSNQSLIRYFPCSTDCRLTTRRRAPPQTSQPSNLSTSQNATRQLSAALSQLDTGCKAARTRKQGSITATGRTELSEPNNEQRMPTAHQQPHATAKQHAGTAAQRTHHRTWGTQRAVRRPPARAHRRLTQRRHKPQLEYHTNRVRIRANKRWARSKATHGQEALSAQAQRNGAGQRHSYRPNPQRRPRRPDARTDGRSLQYDNATTENANVSRGNKEANVARSALASILRSKPCQ